MRTWYCLFQDQQVAIALSTSHHHSKEDTCTEKNKNSGKMQNKKPTKIEEKENILKKAQNSKITEDVQEHWAIGGV